MEHIKDKIFILLLPLLVSLLFYIFFLRSYDCVLTIEEGIENCKILVDLWGTILGFVITAMSILLTVRENRFIKMLMDTGHFKTILFSFTICCIHLIFAVSFALFIIFLKYWNNLIFIIVSATIVDTIVILAICIYFLIKILPRTN